MDASLLSMGGGGVSTGDLVEALLGLAGVGLVDPICRVLRIQGSGFRVQGSGV